MTTQQRGWLEDTTALITGGGTGLGRAIALRFLDEGANVVIVGRSQSTLDEVVATAGDRGERILPVTGDVTSSADMHRAVETAVARFGKLDTLVPNAGIWDYQRSITRLNGEELSAAFDEVFAINVKGYLLAAEAAWPELVKTRGSIIMSLSNSSFYSNGGGPLYTASKFAARGLVTELAYELAPKVRVNGVACGGMNTDLRGPASIGLKDRSIADSFARNPNKGDNPFIPLRDSSVEPEDFTGSYVLLASARNSGNITGNIINVDGGIGVRGFRTAAGGDDL
ncbi:3-(cis-5,6-dihydroxycyclohexa-1,3-dien-1-yl)propanoate dehydrogenase [Cryobacterium frigoriphilum]|uniref:3-(Cis-5,6-dihydroxycyclohexa-1, 3-dien-1-yl)propanoate dehydrogenase n=1 Tax=Cryobacterium frigoriphilum TaxID=1259150 RepID=A0A4R9A584_9MICO|nr:3-(cis-5,6-dihydroxycyclohexa-1,3-dien-1-yl)propanoate dehydrogenase [Cryobacterium frigoriphilum]TFD52282.1 3-(cis-5,6-dihydroxycyclohexa-1,3-dien-1-yl)propanoate dehydrogenase [Cryobacterium frigoriphilum]